MLNCGLGDLRLVNPRDGWPNPRAVSAASGADPVLDAARVYPTLREAVADLRHVYASTARDRYMVKREVTPRLAAEQRNPRRSILPPTNPAARGPGRSAPASVDNADITLADTVLSVPTEPFSGFISQSGAAGGADRRLRVVHRPRGLPPARDAAHHRATAFPATGRRARPISRSFRGSALVDSGFIRASAMQAAEPLPQPAGLFQRGLPDRAGELRTLHGVVTSLRGATAQRPATTTNVAMDTSRGDLVREAKSWSSR